MLIILVFCYCNVLAAEDEVVISRQDLTNTVLGFEKVTELDEQGNRRMVHIGELIDWDVRKRKNDIQYSDTIHWVTVPYGLEPTDPNGGQPNAQPWLQQYEYYLFIDILGHELQQNILTIWTAFTDDSLRLSCANYSDGVFATSVGTAQILKSAALPDKSVILVAEFYDGEGDHSFRFFREQSECEFSEFYRVGSSSDDFDKQGKDYSFVLDYLQYPSSQCVELLHHLTNVMIVDQGVTFRRREIDSVEIKIIDLWQLARKHYDLSELSR